jgi:hypothetical protein
MPDGWGTRRDIYISNDGHHLIVAANEDCFCTDYFASFYRDGQRLKLVRTSELVPFWRQGITNLCRRPIGLASSHFDENALTYAATTTEGEHFVFDVTTGQLVRHSSYLPLLLVMLTLLLTAPIVGGAWWWCRRGR